MNDLERSLKCSLWNGIGDVMTKENSPKGNRPTLSLPAQPAAEFPTPIQKPEVELPAPHEPMPEDRPPRVQPRITAAPKIRQVYWCDMWPDAHLPEMWKTRPVVVISYKNQLHGPCLVAACSTDPQDKNPWAYKMQTSIDGRQSWVVCNHLYTVAPSRFSQSKGLIPMVTKKEFNEILSRIMRWLPVKFDI
jgi:mRNA interferase MazF